MNIFLAMHRINITLKEIVKESNLFITFNELIIIITLAMNTSYVGQIHNRTMIDKASIVRTLASLQRKRFVKKNISKTIPRYELTAAGEILLDFVKGEESAIYSQLGYEDKKIEEVTGTLVDIGDKLSLG